MGGGRGMEGEGLGTSTASCALVFLMPFRVSDSPMVVRHS